MALAGGQVMMTQEDWIGFIGCAACILVALWFGL